MRKQLRASDMYRAYYDGYGKVPIQNVSVYYLKREPEMLGVSWAIVVFNDKTEITQKIFSHKGLIQFVKKVNKCLKEIRHDDIDKYSIQE